jgi:protein tyrosine phosphatase (PTP) superfamily phosphohydrolase (DUF442 family)
LGGALAGLALAAGAEAVHVTFGSNFHAVIPGRVYRSAQLSGHDLERLTRTYGIRTVVNLRGCSAPLAWYAEEVRATHRLDVAQEDISFSAGRLPSSHELRRLLQVFDRTEYPILLHCRQGADRTGLAAAFVVLLQTDAGLPEARQQLGLRYGHVPLDRAGHLDRFLDLYGGWLRREGVAHTPDALRRWIASDLCPGVCRCTYELLGRPAAFRRSEPAGVRVRVANTGTEEWHFRASNNAGHHLVFLLKDQENHLLTTGRCGLLNADVGPGQAIHLTAALPAMRRGSYRLTLDMLDERQGWFSQLGTEPLEMELEVHD